ncbi:MAG: LysR family transcriptional regulator [Boseongicola sp.]|nr:LysR family transcriptional regulator [Boseongicola sp.]MYH57266.1 LysR family transcriptional regulator [Boseongicola sp. SB0675_bin_26]
MPFTLKQVRYFVGVAEHGSFSRAAVELAISQSALTEAVKELEGHLGIKLFERRRRGIEVTHHGHVFMRHAKAILAEVSSAETSLADGNGRLGGTLNIGVTSLTSGYVLSDLLARFRRSQPEVEVSALEDTSEYLEHLLIGGELDVAVMLVGNLRNPFALHSELLSVSPYRLWLSLGHPLTAAESISLEDLTGEAQIVLDVDEMREETSRLMSSFPARPRIAFRTRSVEAVRSLVASGAGVSLMPDMVYRPWSLEGNRMESRDVSVQMPVVQVGLVWRRGASVSRATRAFLSVAQSGHGSRPR